jgi:hypothetical protein
MAMKTRRLVRAFIWFLASLAIFLIFVVFDWYPTVKELGRLRREQRNVILKIKNFTAMASSFVFPDEEEKSHFVKSHADLFRLLMQADDDAPWLNRVLSWLLRQAEADKVDGALLLFSSEPGGIVAPGVRLTGQTPMAAWLAGQQQDIQESLKEASYPGRFPWKGVFASPDFICKHRLAGRPLAIAIEARLPVLLNFINHSSWDYSRLEIVRLRLEPGASLPRAWLVLRGYYLVRGPSPWAMQEGTGNDTGLLVDPDSSLLWQKVDPGTAYWVKKMELPAAAGRGGK